MPIINFRLKDGTEAVVDAAKGDTVMQAAVSEGIRGLLADCGGSCSCATCHVYIADAFLDRMPPIAEIENEMLEGVASERLKGSRLSCQIRMTDELDGLVVEIPDRQ